MMKQKFISYIFTIISLPAFAQNLNTEITVNHEVVPEERAATRLRMLPQLSLPKVEAGRLPVASRFVPTQISPFINPLDATGYLDQSPVYPWRGYAMLGYGPIYNLNGSLGYRVVDRPTLTTDVYAQFNGMSYKRTYAGLPEFMKNYDGKVCFRRQAVLGGADLRWSAGNGILDASLLYQYQGYNFPILLLQQPPATDKHEINANRANLKLGWSSTVNNFDYSIAADYSMVYFGKGDATNNRGRLSASGAWRSSTKSVWRIDLGFSLDNSVITGNKGILHILPRYCFNISTFNLSVGADVDIKTGNCKSSKSLLVSPDLNIVWRPSAMFNAWGKLSGRMVDNYRGSLLDEQPYLLPDFDTGISRIYSGEVGITVGPVRAFSIQFFGGYDVAYDWYMPAVETGYMQAMDVKGFRWGGAVNYDWRRILSVAVRLDMAESPRGNYERGYAIWRDHAKLNLTANLAVRPIKQLEIGVGYHLRSGRQKTLGSDKNLNLLNISNLSASINYNIDRRWSVFAKGENLLNKNWYLGPAVPCQGIMGMVGAAYKF